jgi:hypothetical protein
MLTVCTAITALNRYWFGTGITRAVRPSRGG